MQQLMQHEIAACKAALNGLKMRRNFPLSGLGGRNKGHWTVYASPLACQ